MLFISWLPGDKVIQALCWTLLHSLWQGLILAIAAIIIITATRKSSSFVRYNLLTALFMLFLAGAGMTFFLEIISRKVQSSTIDFSPVTQLANPPGIIDGKLITVSTEPGYFNKIMRYLNEHASLIVAIWFIVFSIKLVRIIVNIGYIQHIRQNKTFEPSFYWKQRIRELARVLGIQHSISLLESSLIKAPMVLGMLKPVILLPLGIIASLPPEQVEAVLFHELAHIRRKDYLVNLFQNFAEAIFFFNPAALWISSLIREERENCCDDITIGLTKNKKEFIHALVAFQEYTQLETKSIVIAFAGQRKYLLNRVKRIIYSENKKLNAMEKGFFIFSIVGISLIGFSSVKQLSRQKPGSGNVTLPAIVSDTIPVKRNANVSDTIPGSPEFNNITSYINKDGGNETRTITATDKKGKEYKIIMKEEEPMELYVNDKKISPEEMGNYKEIINSIEEEVETRQKTDMVKMKLAQAEQGKKISQLDAERYELLARLSALDQERAKLDYERSEHPEDHEWEDAATNKYLNDMKMELRNKDFNKQQRAQSFLKDQLLFNQNEDRAMDLQKELSDEKAKSLSNDHFYDLLQDYKENLQGNKQVLDDRMEGSENDALVQLQQQDYILIDPIIGDLVEQKIVPPHQEDLSFELSDKAFIVNGKKQSAEVHDRFRKKYLKKEGDYFKYSRKNGGTSTTIKHN